MASQTLAATKPTSTVEEYKQGVTREWLYDKRIVVITRPNTTRETVDAWFEVIKKTYEDWPADRAFISLNDFTAGYTHTPYETARIKELTSMPKKGYLVYSAAVLPKTFARSLIMMLMGTIQLLRRKDLDQRLFFDKDEALAWVKSCMEKVEAGTLPSVMKPTKR